MENETSYSENLTVDDTLQLLTLGSMLEWCRIYPCHVNYTEKTSLCIALTNEEPYSAGVIATCDGRSDAGMDVTRGSMRRNRSVIEIVPATKN